MIALAGAAVFLLVSHVVPASARVRSVIVGRIGERAYLAAYSVIAVLAFATLVGAYRRAPHYPVWSAPDGVKLAIAPLMAIAFVLVFAGLTTPNPTIVGAGRAFARPDVVRGILRVTRNPFLWGTGLWAFGHVVVTGDVASIVAFGAVAALGLGGTIVLDAKKARTHAVHWGGFAGATSNVPFAAVLGGRQRLVIGEIGWWRIAAAVTLWCVVVSGHRWAFGVSPVPGTSALGRTLATSVE